MIAAAYRLEHFELVGGPQWISSARYDVTAKTDQAVSGPQLWAMMQSLLEERFRLRIHRERREVAALNLKIAVPGKLPRPRSGTCTGSDPLAIPEPPKAGKATLFPCNTIVMPRQVSGLAMQGGQITMVAFAQHLTGFLERPVIDQTGFSGVFDLDLKFRSDDFAPGNPALARPEEPAQDPPLNPRESLELPSLSSALRSQLGLALYPGKTQLEVVVIDGIEKPSEN